MVDPPWNLEDPPAEPPSGCRYPERWREHYEHWREHQANAAGYCRICEVAWPCAESRFAVRGLLDAYVGSGHAVLSTSVQVGDTVRCRWCGYMIQLHGQWGWLHVERVAGLILCRQPRLGCPPLCSAERASES
jgi:hypothetical protein